MMGGRVALCIDEETCRHPEAVGLEGESLESQGWLEVFLSGEEARGAIGRDEGIDEAWIVSSEDVEPINLAATLKADRPDLCVRLVEFNGCGSLFSRAHTALIDEVVNRGRFVHLYAEAKGARSKAAFRENAPGQDDDPRDASARDELSTTVSVQGAHSEASSSEAFPAAGAHALSKAQAGETGASSEPAAQQAPRASVPLHAVQPRLLVQSPPAPAATHAFVLPVVSGSGGAGKSSVSVLGAIMASNMGYRTLLLDYDLQFGDAAVMAGRQYALTIDEAMARPDKLHTELARDEKLFVLAAPERLEVADEVVHGMPALLDSLCAAFDVVVANTGAAWADQHAVLLERSSAALFLIDQRASSVRACKHALELCARCGIASGPFRFAVNRCSKNAPLTAMDVASALQGASVFELRDGGRDVEDYLSGGAAAELLASGNEFCESLQQVMARLLPGAAEQQASQQMPEGGASRRRARHVNRKRKWSFR